MMWLRATSLLLFFIACCSIARVTSYAELKYCFGESICRIHFATSCTAMAADLDYSGGCCSLVTNSNSSENNDNTTCTLVTNSGCSTYNRLSECRYDVDASGMYCLAGHYITYGVDDSITESSLCPASDIDVLSREPSSNREWLGLLMSLTGVTETDMSDENVKVWEEVTKNHILSFFANNTNTIGITDVKGYIVYNSLNQTETDENQISITYYQQMSWRLMSGEIEDYIDNETIPEVPFLSEGDMAAYIAALNENGIPATQVNVTILAMSVDNSTEGGMGDGDENASNLPDQSPSAGDDTESKINTAGDDGSNGGIDGNETNESASRSVEVASITALAISLMVALL